MGDESYAARLTRSAKEIRRPKSVLMTEVNRLIRIVSAALIPIGLLLFCKQFFLQHLPLTTAVPTSVAAMIGMIPEGLILLISVALAVGVIKLGKRNTLVQELYGIETLSRADVLCLDKTGTITTGKMTLDSLLPLSGDEGAMRTQLGRFLSSMDERSGTLDALRAEIPDVQGEKPVAVLPFSSERKKSAVSFADGTTLILGAPTFVLDDAHLAPIRKTLSDCAGRGLRVLVLAEADGCVTETDTPAIARVIGLCLLTDEIRPAAQETLHYFHTQGVALKIISGDDEKTVAAIARKVGLSGGAVDASTLSDDELPDACERYAVFGRVTPTRKKALVEALKAKGHHVAMTGDGVNDIPALKAADCSIAMAGGADATKQAAVFLRLGAADAAVPGRIPLPADSADAHFLADNWSSGISADARTESGPHTGQFPAHGADAGDSRCGGGVHLLHGGNGRREFRLGYGGLQDAGGAVRGRGRADDALFRLRPADEAARGGVHRHDRRIRAGGVLFQADFLF